MLLRNKISIITGGATGIGRATVETFAKEGATVIFCDINNKQGKIIEKKLQNKGYKVYFKKADVSKEYQVKNLINYTIKKVTDNIDLFHYNKAIANIHEFINNAQKFIIKKTISKKEAINSFKKLALIIQPFIPHLSEEIWKKFGGKKLAIEQDWPMVDKSLLIRNFNIAVQINGKTKEILSLTQELDKDSVVNILKENNKITRLLKNKTVIKTIYVSGKIINFVTN